MHLCACVVKVTHKNSVRFERCNLINFTANLGEQRKDCDAADSAQAGQG
jgi:hypothetical protein